MGTRQAAYRKVGIVGSGTIGRAVYDRVVRSGAAEISFVLVRDAARTARDHPDLAPVLVDDVEKALARHADLVVEAAHPDILAALGARILGSTDLCGFSCSALAVAETEAAINEAATANGTRFFLPHGAVLGLDGLMDGRDTIDAVTVTTTKSGKSLGLDAAASGVLFEGATRGACREFPRNVNVHAAVAIAGLGFDRTRSIVVADPETRQMRHRIEVSGQGLAWDISVSSQSLGGVSGAYTPRSAAGSIARILGLSPIINV